MWQDCRKKDEVTKKYGGKHVSIRKTHRHMCPRCALFHDFSKARDVFAICLIQLGANTAATCAIRTRWD
jgi:uncharacterized protein (DUF983 family)